MIPNIITTETETAQPDVALATTSGGDSFIDAAAANIGQGTITVSDFPRIKVPTGGGTQWLVPGLEGEHMEQTIEGIIVLARNTRVYWEKSADDPTAGKNPPDCSSADALVGIGRPGGFCSHEDSKLACPLAKYGSDKGGKAAGQACKEVKQLFFLRGDSLLPEVIGLPPTSLKHVRQYMVSLTCNKVPYFAALTRIGLEKRINPANKPYAVATFTYVRRLTPGELTKSLQYHDMVAPMLQAMGADTETARDSAAQEA